MHIHNAVLQFEILFLKFYSTLFISNSWKSQLLKLIHRNEPIEYQLKLSKN